MKKNILIVLFGIFAIFQAEAHVQLNNPTGRDTLTPGDTIIINWQILIPHSTQSWDLFFSQDGGISWDTIKTGIAKDSLNYTWVIPSTPTTEAKVRVVMNNTGTNYLDESDAFTISTPSGIIKPKVPNILNSYPNPLTSYTWVEFENHNKMLTFSLFDINGRLVRKVSHINSNKIKVERGKLESGLYLFQLHSGADILGTGKLLIE